ncbi:hypothetical protein SCB29_21455 [Paraburkholderia sp. SIMBA_055]
MSTQKIKFPRSSDRRVAETFYELAKKFNIPSASVGALAFANIGVISLLEEATGDWKVLLDQDSYLIDTVNASLRGLTIQYARGGQCSPEQKSPIFDEIIFSFNNPQQNALQNSEKISVVAFINEKLNPFDPGRTVESGSLSKEQNQLLAIHNSTLERLEQLNEALIRQGTEFREKLDQRFDERVSAVEGDYAQKKRELDAEIEARVTEVDERQRLLDEKLKAIDDRDNTHARREIRERMLEDVKQRISQFGVSKITERKRMPVLYGMLALIFAFVVLLSWTGYEIRAMDQQYYSQLEAMRNISSAGVDKLKAAGLSAEAIAKASAVDADRRDIWWLWGRFTLLSFGLVGTIIYYIKWQNRWAEQHVASEFQLQQFYIDVNRANWVVESCLEWRKVADSEMPSDLLRNIAGNLFVDSQSESEKVIHPADELASALLGTASKLRLKIGENEMDFDKPSKIVNKEIKVNGVADKA